MNIWPFMNMGAKGAKFYGCKVQAACYLGFYRTLWCFCISLYWSAVAVDLPCWTGKTELFICLGACVKNTWHIVLWIALACLATLHFILEVWWIKRTWRMTKDTQPCLWNICNVSFLIQRHAMNEGKKQQQIFTIYKESLLCENSTL